VEVEESPSSAKIPCKYGATCYRRSKEHLERFSHPPKSPTKKPKNEESPSPAPAPAPAPAPSPAPAAPSPSSPVPAIPAPGPASGPTPAPSGDSSEHTRRRTLHFSSTSKQAATVETESETLQIQPEQTCSFGVNCYRKNILHFLEFYHPSNHPLIAGGKMKGALIFGEVRLSIYLYVFICPILFNFTRFFSPFCFH